MMMSRSNYNYQSKKDEQAPLTMRMKDIAATRVRYGYKRIHILRKREGWQINHKRVHRLYCLEGLNLRAKGKRKRIRSLKRPERPTATRINESWSMDFVSDALFNGRRFRALTIVDNFSRECPAILVGQNLRGDEVVDLLDHLKLVRGVPETICVDNGSEFVSKVMDKWAYEHGVKLSFSRPGKPTDNPFVESFNGSFRDECLNVNWFLSIDDAKQKIETWRRDYNEFRPHSSLENMTPSRFAELNHPKVA
jgi:putative transposase